MRWGFLHRLKKHLPLSGHRPPPISNERGLRRGISSALEVAYFPGPSTMLVASLCHKRYRRTPSTARQIRRLHELGRFSS
jgi:hypothetical protein